MNRIVVALLAAVLASCETAGAQQFPETFRFASVEAGKPAGWRGGPAGTIGVDSVVFRSAPYSGHLRRDASSEGAFSVFTISLPVTFSGSEVELRGWVRTAAAESGGSLWLRQDGVSGQLALDNMHDRVMRGTSEWQQLSIRMPLNPNARTLFFGALLRGTGEAWVDDLELLIDGRPFTQAPAARKGSSAFARDTMFDHGSHITDAELSEQQIDNLALLAKIWGFVKYHHPSVTGGKVHWDYELFRIYPVVAAAKDRDSATRAISAWLEQLGDPPPCSPCAQLGFGPHIALYPEVTWIRDTSSLGPALARQLENIYRNRRPHESQHYVTLTPNVRNPLFEQEANYSHISSSDAGYRMLALFRFWNIIQYWFPYRDGMERAWDEVLRASIPRFAATMTDEDYHLALMRLSVQILDTHSNLWRSLQSRPPRGDAQVPVLMRFIGNRAVVWSLLPAKQPVAHVLQPGDVIARIDGVPVDTLVQQWRPYYSASNEPTRLRDIGRSLTRGRAGPVFMDIVRNGQRMAVETSRVPMAQLDFSRASVHDLNGEAFQLLDPRVAYLKLSAVKVADIGSYLERARDTQVFVIDIRNYPSEFVPFALGGHLVDKPTPFVKFTRGDLGNPGAFLWADAISIQPLRPKYNGKVVVLVDEATQSSAEYTAMAMRAAGATIFGSTTAGADGNVSTIPLPGGLTNMISGIGVFYPDGTPTQRVGIVPDHVVLPTIAGIRAGRDEVLEAAVSTALGEAFTVRGR